MKCLPGLAVMMYDSKQQGMKQERICLHAHIASSYVQVYSTSLVCSLLFVHMPVLTGLAIQALFYIMTFQYSSL